MRHGTPSSYTSGGCRCDACRKAHREYAREGARLRRAGQQRLVSAAAAREHLLHLQGQGVGIRAVVKHARISAETVIRIRSGNQLTTDPAIETRILALTPDIVPLFLTCRLAWSRAKRAGWRPPLTGFAEGPR